MTEDSATRLLADSDKNAAIARKTLTTPTPDQIKQLPIAKPRTMHGNPELMPSGTSVCGARGRITVDTLGVRQILAVSCRLRPGHSGTHIAQAEWEFPRMWKIWAWSDK